MLHSYNEDIRHGYNKEMMDTRNIFEKQNDVMIENPNSVNACNRFE